MEIRVKKLHPEAVLPKRGSSAAAGSDIELGAYVDASGTEYANYLLIALEPINFADYLD